MNHSLQIAANDESFEVQTVAAVRQELRSYDRDETIAAIKKALRARSGKSWSVTGGTGTAWGWIKIHAMPKRRSNGPFSGMTAEDAQELKTLLGLERADTSGESIPASTAYRAEYIDRAEGRAPSRLGQPYWD